MESRQSSRQFPKNFILIFFAFFLTVAVLLTITALVFPKYSLATAGEGCSDGCGCTSDFWPDQCYDWCGFPTGLCPAPTPTPPPASGDIKANGADVQYNAVVGEVVDITWTFQNLTNPNIYSQEAGAKFVLVDPSGSIPYTADNGTYAEERQTWRLRDGGIDIDTVEIYVWDPPGSVDPLSAQVVCSPSKKIQLSWSATYPVTNYHIYRCNGSVTNCSDLGEGGTTYDGIAYVNGLSYSSTYPISNPGTYSYRVRAHHHPTNAFGPYSNTETITYSNSTCNNQPPIAKAGVTEPIIYDTQKTQLYDNGSYDPNGDSLTYSWDCGGQGVLNYNHPPATYDWTPPDLPTGKTQQFTCTLTVSDGASTDSDTVTIEVRDETLSPPPEPPVAVATANPSTINDTQTSQLDGSGSYDPDNSPNPLTYSWSCTGGAVSSPTSVKSTWTPPNIVGGKSDQFTCTLTVSDGASTDSDTVLITVNDACTPTAPSAPTLSSPANGALVDSNSVVLDWNPVTSWGNSCGAAGNKYYVYVSKKISFIPLELIPIPKVNPGTTAYDLSANLALSVNTRYYWKIRAVNGAGKTTDSEVRSFKTASPDLTASQPQVVGNAALEAGNEIRFETDITNIGTLTTGSASFYNIFLIDKNKDNTADVLLYTEPILANLDSGSTQTVVSDPWVVEEGDYRVWARADALNNIDESNESNNWSYWEFTVNPPSGSCTYTLSNSGNVITKPNSSESTIINVNHQTGALCEVLFNNTSSVQGLPAGVSAAFSPSSCKPSSSGASCAVNLTFTVPAGTPLGTYPITVVDDGPNNMSTIFDLVITSAETFDYELSNDGDILLEPGGAIKTSSITATLTSISGSPPPQVSVSFDSAGVSTVPELQSITHWFLPPSECTLNPTVGDNCSVKLNFQANAAAPLGQYAITVKDAAPLQKTTSFNLEVSDPLVVSCQPTQNGNPVTEVNVGEYVTWISNVSGGLGPGTYTYQWTGDDFVDGATSADVTGAYISRGSKSASLKVSSGMRNSGTIDCGSVLAKGFIDDFHADPNPVNAGNNTTLYWQTTGYADNECSIDGPSLSPTPVPADGSLGPFSFAPPGIRTYHLVCPDDSSAEKIVVTSRTGPQIEFRAAPGVINPGEKTTLQWNATGGFTSCTLKDSGGNNIPIGGATNGSVEVAPLETETYTLTCYGLGIPVPRDATVVVTGTPKTRETNPK